MFVCPKCGVRTAADLKRCRRDREDECQFERLAEQRKSHPFSGLFCLLMGIAAALGISTVLFVTPGQDEGSMAIVQAVALVGVYTFVYTITGVFVVVGLLLLFYRQQDLKDRNGDRFVQIASLLGKTLSFQTVDVEAPSELTGYPAPPGIPASIAALHQVVSEAQLQAPAGSLNERLTHLNEVSDRLTRECLASAMVNLVVYGAIEVRPADVRIVWPILSRSPGFTLRTHLFEAVAERPPSGALELLLWERTRDWPSSQQGDYPLATMRELVETFEDSDGDFSQREILDAVEDEAVANGWFNRRRRFSLKRLLPEPNPEAGATIREPVDAWMRILDDFRHHESDLLWQMERDIVKVVDPDKGERSELEIAQGSLRKTMALRLIGLAAFTATVVYLVSRIV